MTSALNAVQRRLVEENLPLAYWHVERWLRQHPQHERHRDDLKQEAAMAMMRAATTFDPARGFKFGTYAKQPIRTALWTYSLKARTAVGVMFTKVDGVQKVAKPEMVSEVALEHLSTPPIDTDHFDAPGLMDRAAKELTERQMAEWRALPERTTTEERALKRVTRSTVGFLADHFGDEPMQVVARRLGTHGHVIKAAGRRAEPHFAKWAEAIRRESA